MESVRGYVTNVDDVQYVINFDYPNCSEDYVHRIGRTGRSNHTGTSYTFFTPENAPKSADLISVLKEANQVVNPKLLELVDRARMFGGKGSKSRWGGGDRRSGGGSSRGGGRDSGRGFSSSGGGYSGRGSSSGGSRGGMRGGSQSYAPSAPQAVARSGGGSAGGYSQQNGQYGAAAPATNGFSQSYGQPTPQQAPAYNYPQTDTSQQQYYPQQQQQMWGNQMYQ